MKLNKVIILFLGIILASGCVNNQFNPKTLPKELKVNSTVQLPNPTPLGIYIPSTFTSSYYYDKYSARSIEYGKALQKGTLDVSQVFFADVTFKEQNPNKTFGLFLDIQPKWDVTAGNVGLIYDYQVLNAQFEVVLTGTQSYSRSINYQAPENTFYNTSVRVSQKMFVDISNKLLKGQKSYAGTAKISDIPNQMLANLEKPISTSVAYKINGDGHLITSLSEINQCLVIKTENSGTTTNVDVVDDSWLLDLVILKSPESSENYLQFTKAPLKVGTSVSTISYQNNADKNSSAPLLSFGHIISTEGISGSLGVFQFATATKPESKGAPILNSNGLIVGMLTGEYNTKYLSDKEIISANNHFALKNEYLNKFLDVKGIPYSFSNDDEEVDITETLLANTVKLNCYE